MLFLQPARHPVQSQDSVLRLTPQNTLSATLRLLTRRVRCERPDSPPGTRVVLYPPKSELLLHKTRCRQAQTHLHARAPVKFGQRGLSHSVFFLLLTVPLEA